MAVGRGDDTGNTKSEPTNKPRATAEPKAEKDDHSESVEEEYSEEMNKTGTPNATHSTVTSGATLGAVGVTAETARRLGTDRYAEAGFAEQAYAEAYAKKVGGTVVDDGTSVFTPDGGIDKIVQTSSGEIRIQSKHYGRVVGNRTLEDHAGKVDVIGATNGIAESVDPEAYGVDVVTSDDWLWRTKAKLQGKRVIRGCNRGITAIKNGVQAVASRLVDGAKFGARCAIFSGKWLFRRLFKASTVATKWFKRRSLMTQLVLIVAVVGFLYLLWNWYNDENEEEAGSEDSTDTV